MLAVQTGDMASLLPHLPPELPREQVLYFDATEMLVGACRLHYGRMLAVAEAIDAAQAEDGGTPEDLQVAIFADAGALIGSVQRLRGVVRRLRGDPATRVKRKAFEAAVRANEAARHHLEHLETSIPALVETGLGPFGSLSWQHLNFEDGEPAGFTATMLVPGHLAIGEAVASTRIHGVFYGAIDHFSADIGGETYYLSGAARAVDALAARLHDWSLAQMS